LKVEGGRVGLLKRADADKARANASKAPRAKRYIRQSQRQRYDKVPLNCRCERPLPGLDGCCKCGREIT